MPQDATSTWNQFAGSYSFDATNAQGVTPETTFDEAYNGSDFSADFNGILTDIDRVLRPHAAKPPEYNGDDLMLGSLKNYPDDPAPNP